jgi:fructokinase
MSIWSKSEEPYLEMNGVIGMGEAVIDFIPQDRSSEGYQRYIACPGGSVANLCVVVARLGMRSAFIGGIGNDYFGSYLKNTIADYGVNVENAIISKEQGTLLTFVVVLENNERNYFPANFPGADKKIVFDDIDLSLLNDYNVLHISSNAISRGYSALDAQTRVMRRAAELGMVVCYDINYRPANFLDQSKVRETLRLPLGIAGIIKATEEELEIISALPGRNGVNFLLDKGASIILITEGGNGASYYTTKGQGHLDVVSVPVVDTTGAGDAFLGGFLVSMLNNGGFDSFSNDQIKMAVDFGNRVATLSVTKFGSMAGAPTMDDVLMSKFFK